MKKLFLLFFLSVGINQAFAQNLCHEGSGGGPCFTTEQLENGSFDILLDFAYMENCNCPTEVRVNIKKNAQGKYTAIYGAYSLTMEVQDSWILYLVVKRIKTETSCCRLLEGAYSQPGE